MWEIFEYFLKIEMKLNRNYRGVKGSNPWNLKIIKTQISSIFFWFFFYKDPNHTIFLTRYFFSTTKYHPHKQKQPFHCTTINSPRGVSKSHERSYYMEYIKNEMLPHWNHFLLLPKLSHEIFTWETTTTTMAVE